MIPRESAIEVMVPAAVVDEFLPVPFGRFCCRTEVPDYRRLLCGTERAEGRINVSGFIPYRAIIYPVGELDLVPSRERCANRVTGLIQDKHAVPGQEIFQEPYFRGIPTILFPALAGNHVPVFFLFFHDRLVQGFERSLLVIQTDPLVRSEKVFGDLPGHTVAVLGREILDLCLEVPFHLLDLRRGMPEYQGSDRSPEIAAAGCEPEHPASGCNLCAMLFFMALFRQAGEQGHDADTFPDIRLLKSILIISFNEELWCSNIFYMHHSYDYSW